MKNIISKNYINYVTNKYNGYLRKPGTCYVCGDPSSSICYGCKKIQFCSKEHCKKCVNKYHFFYDCKDIKYNDNIKRLV